MFSDRFLKQARRALTRSAPDRANRNGSGGKGDGYAADGDGPDRATTRAAGLDLGSTKVMFGTAGWSIPTAAANLFPGPGSHLERYARQLPAAEINSSFHRRHRPGTYQRWAASVPPDFAFSVKLPKAVTHGQRLVDTETLLDAFATDVAGLGAKLRVILVQLPPSLAFDAAVAKRFFGELAQRWDCLVACEPRHESWFANCADATLASLRVARVAADPVLAPGGEFPGGWPGLLYRRLHGSPRVYYSSYSSAFLHPVAIQLGQERGERWCIFDNTASGAAAANVITLRNAIRRDPGLS